MALLVITLPTVSLFKIGNGGYSVSFVMTMIAFVYLLVNNKRYIHKRNLCPFLIGLAVAFFSYVISGAYNVQPRLIRTIIITCYEYILVVCLWYLYQPNKSNNRFLFSSLFVYMAVLTIYGIQEALTASNPFIDYMYNSGRIVNLQRDDYIRFGLYRAQSLTIWMESFGTVCVFALLFMLNCAFRGIIKFNIRVYVMAILMAVSVFITGSRTMIAMLGIATMSLLPYFYKKTRYMLLFVALIAAFIYSNPEYIKDLIGSFTDTTSVGGSNIEGRMWQLSAAMSYYFNSPMFGNGIGFISEAVKQSDELLGAESIIFKTLVDRGNIGIFSLIFLYLNIFYVLIKRKMYALCFLPLAFAFGKMATLIPGHTEVYVLFWIVLLIKLYDNQKAATSIQSTNDSSVPKELVKP